MNMEERMEMMQNRMGMMQLMEQQKKLNEIQSGNVKAITG
jgi:hypothetical protein